MANDMPVTLVAIGTKHQLSTIRQLMQKPLTGRNRTETDTKSQTTCARLSQTQKSSTKDKRKMTKLEEKRERSRPEQPHDCYIQFSITLAERANLPYVEDMHVIPATADVLRYNVRFWSGTGFLDVLYAACRQSAFKDTAPSAQRDSSQGVFEHCCNRIRDFHV